MITELACQNSLGGMATAFVIFVWSWISNPGKEPYLKPFAPKVFRAIDSRIDVQWRKSFGPAYQNEKASLKTSIHKLLIFAELVKTPQEYGNEQIAKIMADKDHPYHHPEMPGHQMAVREMAKYHRYQNLNSLKCKL